MHTNQIVVCRVSSADELLEDVSAQSVTRIRLWQTDSSSNVWDVHAGIAFTGEVDAPVLHAEQLDEILPESDELCSQLIFRLDVWLAL